MEFDFEAPNGMGPWSAVEDKDGMMWIPYYGRGNAVVKLDPATGEQTAYPLGFARKAGIHSAVPGINGDVWFTEAALGRIGGEEFMVVAPETTPEGALILAERIRCGVESATTAFKGQAIRVTVSVGIAVAEAGVSAGYDQMKYVAAAALAEAKSIGRNRSVVRVLPRQLEASAG